MPNGTHSATIQPMKRIVLSAAILFAMPLAAQTAKPAPETPKAAAPVTPVVSDALKAQFFKAQSFKVQADVQAEKANSIFQAAIAEMRKACGDSHTLTESQSADPVCVAKPERPEKK